jgi:hypothetical protein
MHVGQCLCQGANCIIDDPYWLLQAATEGEEFLPTIKFKFSFLTEQQNNKNKIHSFILHCPMSITLFSIKCILV